MPESSQDIYFYDHNSDELTRETVMGEKLIKWAYQDASAGLVSRMLFHSAFFTKLLGSYYGSALSRGKIEAIIDELSIDPSEFQDEVSTFKTFNQFFTRHLKLDECRPYDADTKVMVSPADGRTLVFPQLEDEMVVPVKGRAYSVKELLQSERDDFNGGALAVVRLCPADYHRYHYPCGGTVIEEKHIDGFYHSVNPIALALGLNVFCENKRCYTIYENEVFGKVVFMEVGAFGVGSIKRTCKEKTFQKMDERGYFEFGGSTVVLVFEPGKIAFEEKLVERSAKGHETLLHVGDTLGKAAES